MIKKTLYFGNDVYLHTKDEQVIIEYVDKSKPIARVPVEDVGVVILDAHRLTVSQRLISKLLENNVALITCDKKHMPQGLMLNLHGHNLQQEKFTNQISATKPLKKQLWQQTIRQKINNQASLLSMVTMISLNELEKMDYWQRSVRSGDPDNYEARAAAFYWSKLFEVFIETFTRGRFDEPPNNLLNYIYAVLRAVTARSLTASGLLPTFGIHHHNKYNAYALADDIMEPYRPFADFLVYQIMDENSDELENTGTIELTTSIKSKLLVLPVMDVMIDGKRSPLMIAMQRTTASLSACYDGVRRTVLYPSFPLD